MKRINKWALLGFMVGVVMSIAHADENSIERYVAPSTGSEVYNLDTSGNERIAGWSVVGGSLTVAGVIGSPTGTALPSLAVAAISALVPSRAGNMVYCSDCARSYVCVSTAAAINSFVVAVETGTITGGPKTRCQ